MSTAVFIAVIGAAVLHALWNALVKGGRDKPLGMTAVVLGQALSGCAVLPFVPAPGIESLPYIVGGIVLHFGYEFFLLGSYRIGDLTQVYPIARGSAPLIVAAVSVFMLDETLLRSELLAVIIITAGIASLALVRQSDGLRNARAGLFALVTGCFIAGYSLVDGMGARVAGTALGYFGWLAIGNAAVFAVFVALRNPGVLSRVPAEGKTPLLVGGGASFAAYALVVWAFTQAPIALVAALRETSIVFALLIGVTCLGERLSLTKLFSTMVTLSGAALIRLARS